MTDKAWFCSLQEAAWSSVLPTNCTSLVVLGGWCGGERRHARPALNHLPPLLLRPGHHLLFSGDLNASSSSELVITAYRTPLLCCKQTLSLSYHIISYHIISYHIISYHIISYHIISLSERLPPKDQVHLPLYQPPSLVHQLLPVRQGSNGLQRLALFDGQSFRRLLLLPINSSYISTAYRNPFLLRGGIINLAGRRICPPAAAPGDAGSTAQPASRSVGLWCWKPAGVPVQPLNVFHALACLHMRPHTTLLCSRRCNGPRPHPPTSTVFRVVSGRAHVPGYYTLATHTRTRPLNSHSKMGCATAGGLDHQHTANAPLLLDYGSSSSTPACLPAAPRRRLRFRGAGRRSSVRFLPPSRINQSACMLAALRVSLRVVKLRCRPTLSSRLVRVRILMTGLFLPLSPAAPCKHHAHETGLAHHSFRDSTRSRAWAGLQQQPGSRLRCMGRRRCGLLRRCAAAAPDGPPRHCKSFY